MARECSHLSFHCPRRCRIFRAAALRIIVAHQRRADQRQPDTPGASCARHRLLWQRRSQPPPGRSARQPRRQRRESFRHHFQRLQIAAIDADQDSHGRRAAAGAEARRTSNSRAPRARSPESNASSSTNRPCSAAASSSCSICDCGQHADDQEYAARACGARLQYLVGVHQEILAHGGHLKGASAALAKRKCSSEPSKREGSVSTDTAAAPLPGVGGHALQPILVCQAEPAGRRRHQFQFRDDVEPLRRQNQRCAASVPAFARLSSAGKRLSSHGLRRPRGARARHLVQEAAHSGLFIASA